MRQYVAGMSGRSGPTSGLIVVIVPFTTHRVPSPETDELDLACFVVATMRGRVVGAANGYWRSALNSRGVTPSQRRNVRLKLDVSP